MEVLERRGGGGGLDLLDEDESLYFGSSFYTIPRDPSSHTDHAKVILGVSPGEIGEGGPKGNELVPEL